TPGAVESRSFGRVRAAQPHLPDDTFSCASTVDEPTRRATTSALVRQGLTRKANEVPNVPVVLVRTTLLWLAVPAEAVTRIQAVRGNCRPTTVSGVTRVA